MCELVEFGVRLEAAVVSGRFRKKCVPHRVAFFGTLRFEGRRDVCWVIARLRLVDRVQPIGHSHDDEFTESIRAFMLLVRAVILPAYRPLRCGGQLQDWFSSLLTRVLSGMA